VKRYKPVPDNVDDITNVVREPGSSVVVDGGTIREPRARLSAFIGCMIPGGIGLLVLLAGLSEGSWFMVAFGVVWTPISVYSVLRGAIYEVVLGSSGEIELRSVIGRRWFRATDVVELHFHPASGWYGGETKTDVCDIKTRGRRIFPVTVSDGIGRALVEPLRRLNPALRVTKKRRQLDPYASGPGTP
jgi:hypothetical protein